MIRVAVVLVLVTGCLRSDSVECDNGITCPSGTLCDEMNGGCVVADQFAACATADDGAMCTWPDGAGECVNGVCLAPICGDGRRSGPERCDPTDPNASMTTCTSVELGYYEGGDVACAADCTWITSPCSGYCGDGMLNGNELCEVNVPPVDSCVDFGFDRGQLGCGACAPAFEQCGFIGWRRRPVPGTPSRVVVVGSAPIAAIERVGSPHLAARYDGNAWIGLGTYPGTDSPAAFAIAANSTSDIWVGGATNTSGDSGFVAHYDGSAWTQKHTFPAVVSAIWASGTQVFAIAGQDLYSYDGTTWTSQTLGASSNGFWISGYSTSDVWIGGTKLWHGGAGQSFAEVTLPVTGTVSGVHAFGPDQVAVAVYEPTPNRLGLQVRENGTWRAVPYTSTGLKQGVPYVRASNDIYLLVTDLTTQALALITHHDGTSWTTLTDASMKPTSLAGSDKAIAAVERGSDTGYHYGGGVWLPRPTVAMSASAAVRAPLAGSRPLEIYAANKDTFQALQIFNGTGWTQTTPRGTPDILSDTVAYAIEPQVTIVNPRLWRRDTLGWQSSNLPNVGADYYVEWIGVLGLNDVYLKEIIGGVPTYLHWAGNIASDAPLETTNLPDGELLDVIDCRPGAGCYAGGATALWRTPGDRNAWVKVTDLDIGAVTAVWVGAPTFVAIGGNSRIAVWNGATWAITQLPTAAPVITIVGASATDAFALTRSDVDEHRLYHWNGTAWYRVRTPVPAFGSNIDQLWTNGPVTYIGNGLRDPLGLFYALVRTESW